MDNHFRHTGGGWNLKLINTRDDPHKAVGSYQGLTDEIYVKKKKRSTNIGPRTKMKVIFFKSKIKKLNTFKIRMNKSNL